MDARQSELIAKAFYKVELLQYSKIKTEELHCKLLQLAIHNETLLALQQAE